jgi:hypothetical protein
MICILKNPPCRYFSLVDKPLYIVLNNFVAKDYLCYNTLINISLIWLYE